MIERRKVLAGGLAAAAGAALPVGAHERGEGYELPEEFMPRLVRLKTRLEPGELHVEPNIFALYWTLPGNRAVRYAVGIGRKNLYHPGTYFVGDRKEWPPWRPTPAMLERDPQAYADFLEGGKYEDGWMPGGIDNPLGARALYLHQPGRGDTFLRIHGTSDPRTIGVAVSNGCARLINEHVIDLYERVPLGTRVVLHPKAGAGPAHS